MAPCSLCPLLHVGTFRVRSLTITLLVLAAPVIATLVYAFLRGSRGMRRYLVVRVLLTIPMVLILSSIVFFVMRVLPGDPSDSELFLRASPQVREEIRANLGLDEPLILQYGEFLGNVFRLDFGDALTGAHRPVVDELGERFPATVELIVPAVVLTFVAGAFLGAVSAKYRRTPADFGLRLSSVVATAMPVFWIALLFQLFFGVVLGITPVAGRIDPVVGTTLDRRTNVLTIDSLISGNWAALGSVLHHLVLPVVTLTIILAGLFLRLTRINVIEVLQQDYIAAARARGIPERRVVYGYALKNALIPVITLLGLQVAILLGGAVLTETVFSWPGMGSYLLERIFARDFTAVQGAIVLFALVVALSSLVVDVLYSLLDPRVRPE